MNRESLVYKVYIRTVVKYIEIPRNEAAMKYIDVMIYFKYIENSPTALEITIILMKYIENRRIALEITTIWFRL